MYLVTEVCDTGSAQRAAITCGRLGSADQGTEIHHGLVVIGRSDLRGSFRAQSPELFQGTALARPTLNGIMSGQDATYIAIQDGCWLVKAQAQNGPGRRASDAR